MNELTSKSILELLALHVDALEELRRRGVLRSANNPVGDLAEYLFCVAFGWKQAANSERGFDATDKDGIRYQIKARRAHRHGSYLQSRHLSAIRSLDTFDMLAVALFDDYYRIKQAALIPASVVRERSKYQRHTNSRIFMATDDVWDIPGVVDVSERLKRVGDSCGGDSLPADSH